MRLLKWIWSGVVLNKLGKSHHVDKGWLLIRKERNFSIALAWITDGFRQRMSILKATKRWDLQMAQSHFCKQCLRCLQVQSLFCTPFALPGLWVCFQRRASYPAERKMWTICILQCFSTPPVSSFYLWEQVILFIVCGWIYKLLDINMVDTQHTESIQSVKHWSEHSKSFTDEEVTQLTRPSQWDINENGGMSCRNLWPKHYSAIFRICTEVRSKVSFLSGAKQL